MRAASGAARRRADVAAARCSAAVRRAKSDLIRPRDNTPPGRAQRSRAALPAAQNTPRGLGPGLARPEPRSLFLAHTVVWNARGGRRGAPAAPPPRWARVQEMEWDKIKLGRADGNPPHHGPPGKKQGARRARGGGRRGSLARWPPRHAASGVPSQTAPLRPPRRVSGNFRLSTCGAYVGGRGQPRLGRPLGVWCAGIN